MDTTVRDTPLRTAETGELQEVWRRAERADLVRTVLLALLAAAVAGSMWLFDLSHWPPRLKQPIAEHLVGSLGLSAVFLVVFAGITGYQKHATPQRHVSPLLGLDPEHRRTAEEALRTATPSTDPVLRQVETTRAEQRVRTAPSSIGVGLITPAIYVGVTVLMFISGMSLVGALWIIVTIWATMTALRNVRASERAQSYLDHLRGTTARV